MKSIGLIHFPGDANIPEQKPSIKRATGSFFERKVIVTVDGQDICATKRSVEKFVERNKNLLGKNYEPSGDIHKSFDRIIFAMKQNEVKGLKNLSESEKEELSKKSFDEIEQAQQKYNQAEYDKKNIETGGDIEILRPPSESPRNSQISEKQTEKMDKVPSSDSYHFPEEEELSPPHTPER